MADVRWEHLGKGFRDRRAVVRAVEDFTLAVADGELLVLVGASGCGKTTTLRLIAGLEAPTTGRVFIDGRDMSGVAPRDRDVAMVFQNYALYPHMTAFDNMAFGLKARRTPKPEIAERVHRAARRLGIESLLDRRPGQLSGGEQQRVALGRAIVRRPRVFLFDEPLANLDMTLRLAARAEIKRLHREFGVTMIHVTHDQEEAMALADRLVVMRAGRLEQVGRPQEVYARPQNRFVAGFLGLPPMSFLEGTVQSVGVHAVVGTSLGRVVLSTRGTGLGEHDGEGVWVGLRAEDVTFVPEIKRSTALQNTSDGEEWCLAPAVVEDVELLGHGMLHRLRTPEGALITARASANDAVGAGVQGRLCFRPSRVHIFARCGSQQRLN